MAEKFRLAVILVSATTPRGLHILCTGDAGKENCLTTIQRGYSDNAIGQAERGAERLRQ